MLPHAGRLALGVALASLLSIPSITTAQTRTQVVCQTSFDPYYLYLAVTVDKPSLRGSNMLPFSDPLKDDCVAVFLDASATDATKKRSDRSTCMAVSVAGGAQIYRGKSATPLKDFTEFIKGADDVPVPFKYAVLPRSEVNRTSNGPTGYTVEMAIPWLELGGPPQTGQIIRFNVAAYSAAPGSPAILSLAPGVHSLDDVQNPSLWPEMVFVDAPVKIAADAPLAKVCHRLFNAKPSIDGTLTQGEWNSLTQFGFAEGDAGVGSVTVSIAGSAARTRIPVALKPARPPIKPTPPAELPDPKPRTGQISTSFLMALYRYDYQADSRRAFAGALSRPGNGAKITSHPMEGSGPWIGYDRVDWHSQQFEQMRSAGIDTALPIFRDSPSDRAGYARAGLDAIVSALRSLDRQKKDYPQVGLYLDAASLATETGKLDVSNSEGRARLFEAVRAFYQRVPEQYRATAFLSPDKGGRSAIMVISSAASLTGLSGEFTLDLRKRFQREFGSDLVVLGDRGFNSNVGLDGVLSLTPSNQTASNSAGATGIAQESENPQTPTSIPVSSTVDKAAPPPPVIGWIRTARISLSPVAKAGTITVPAPSGDGYRTAWKDAVSQKAPWIVVDSWNNLDAGGGIAPTEEYGLTFADSTRTYLRMLQSGRSALAGTLASHNVPSLMLAGANYIVHLRVRNTGSGIWKPETNAIALRLSTGKEIVVSLPVIVPPGEVAVVDAVLPIAGKGPANVTVEVVPASRKGNAMQVTGAGEAVASIPVQIASGAADGLPGYRLTVVSTDSPTAFEAGGVYMVSAVLRNEGAETWKANATTRVSLRLWKTSIAEDGSVTEEPLNLADASVPLSGDVAPGQEIAVKVRLCLSNATGAAAAVTPAGAASSLKARWEVSTDETGTTGASAIAGTIAIVESDIGVLFNIDNTPLQLPGDKRLPIQMGLRNTGPQTWKKDAVRIGYHWYSLDGGEVVWDDETTALPNDVEPGGETGEVFAWVTPPPNDGVYFLVWDVKVGDTWVSTMPCLRPYETRVHRIEIVNGRLHFVNLDKYFNMDGIASASSPGDGNFDGSGGTLPEELAPPLATTSVVPSGLWVSTATGAENSKRMQYRWGGKGLGEKNMIRPEGQKIMIDLDKKAPATKVVHFLATSTEPESRFDVTLLYENGSQAFSSRLISGWAGDPKFSEEVAFKFPFTYSKSGEPTGKPAKLYRYSMKLNEKSRLISIQLPKLPSVRILAITLEN
jgi:hypothetical protein